MYVCFAFVKTVMFEQMCVATKQTQEKLWQRCSAVTRGLGAPRHIQTPPSACNVC